MRVAIVGSRDFPRLDLVRRYVRELPPGTVVVTGGARGVDRAAEEEARAQGLEVVVHLADWVELGRRAGPVRNTVVVAESDLVVAFWDGRSKGTRDVVSKAERMGKTLRIVYPWTHSREREEPTKLDRSRKPYYEEWYSDRTAMDDERKRRIVWDATSDQARKALRNAAITNQISPSAMADLAKQFKELKK